MLRLVAPHTGAWIETSDLVGVRPAWIAASTHPGEEEIAVETHQALAGRMPDLLTIVAPRHPERGPGIADMAEAAGLSVGVRSEGHLPERDVSFYVADTVGELGLFYRLSPLVFLGGSLVPHGGQNPIEPARLDAAILHGPHVGNFSEVYAALDAVGGARPVLDADDLAVSVGDLLSDPERLQAMAQAGQGAFRPFEGAVERTLAVLDPFVAQMKLAAMTAS